MTLFNIKYCCNRCCLLSWILFRHRTEGSREIALRLRELSVLPPFRANRRSFVLANNISNNLPLSEFVRMPEKDKDNGSRKETSGHKRKAQDNPRCTLDHIEVNVVENDPKLSIHLLTVVHRHQPS